MLGVAAAVSSALELHLVLIISSVFFLNSTVANVKVNFCLGVHDESIKRLIAIMS